MNKELIINSNAEEVYIALLEDKQLVELNKEQSNNAFSVGDVFLGKVKKIMPGLNAAFVDVGYEKDAFLHYLDLGTQIKTLNKLTKQLLDGSNLPSFDTLELEPDIEKTGKIGNVIKINQEILVQIAKEPISTKGPRVSSDISFAGRYLVLIPFANRISVSQKIKSADERSRLKRLIMSIKPNNYGIIIRTVAENKMVADLISDLNYLMEKWNASINNIHQIKAPQKVLSELNRTSTMLRDLLNESFQNIHVNDAILYEEIKNYISTIAPDKIDIVKLYKGREPIFDSFGVEKQIKSLFGKTVSARSGVYLIIEHTEALHVIDVNSGHHISTSGKNQETNAIEVNIEAAYEIARQLRLRDMGGIIVIDFIDMQEPSNRRKLYQFLKDEMAKDKARHNILPPSKFGLVQITRQRVRPIAEVIVAEKCPTCEGSGEIRSSIIITDEIENNISYLLNEQNEKKINIQTHPFIHAFLTKKIFSKQIEWFVKYKKWIKIKPNTSYHFLEYHFFDKKNEEIKI